MARVSWASRPWSAAWRLSGLVWCGLVPPCLGEQFYSWVSDDASDIGKNSVATVSFSALMGWLIIAVNLPVLIALLMDYKLKQTVTFRLLTGQACLDLTVGLVIAVAETVSLAQGGGVFVPGTGCDVLAVLIFAFACASCVSLCLIAFERWRTVTRSAGASGRRALLPTITHARVVPVFVVACTVWGFLPVFIIGLTEGGMPSPATLFCLPYMLNAGVAASCLLLIMLPMAVMIAFNLDIYFFVRKFRKAVLETTGSGAPGPGRAPGSSGTLGSDDRLHTAGTAGKASPGEKLAQAERSLAVRMAMLVFFFILCWSPFVVEMWLFMLDKHIPGKLDNTMLFLGSVNSLVNPILYGLATKDVRAAIYNVLTCDKKALTDAAYRSRQEAASSVEMSRPSTAAPLSNQPIAVARPASKAPVQPQSSVLSAGSNHSQA